MTTAVVATNNLVILNTKPVLIEKPDSVELTYLPLLELFSSKRPKFDSAMKKVRPTYIKYEDLLGLFNKKKFANLASVLLIRFFPEELEVETLLKFITSLLPEVMVFAGKKLKEKDADKFDVRQLLEAQKTLKTAFARNVVTDLLRKHFKGYEESSVEEYEALFGPKVH